MAASGVWAQGYVTAVAVKTTSCAVRSMRGAGILDPRLMDMNRRKFLQACGLAIATTAIGLRLSRGMPEAIELPRTYMMDHTDHFLYGINQDDPFDVLVWHRTEPEMTLENALSIPEINSNAVWEDHELRMHDVFPGPMPDTRHLELCASVQMSRGYRWCGGPFSTPMADAAIPCAQI